MALYESLQDVNLFMSDIFLFEVIYNNVETDGNDNDKMYISAIE